MCRKLQVSMNTKVYFDAVYLVSLFSLENYSLYIHAVIGFIELMLNNNKMHCFVWLFLLNCLSFF
jgi:hypothetical protein